MKKNHADGEAFIAPALAKLLKIMRLTTAILFATALSASAGVYSQDAKVSLSLNGVKLTRLFKAIEKESGYRFAYSNDIIPAGKFVTVNVKEKPVSEVLASVLSKTTLKYRFDGESGIIIIAEKTDEDKTFAAEKKITGKVTNEKGEGLSGVTVQLKSSAIFTTTSVDGSFVITVPDNAKILVFTYVGMESQELSISGKSSVQVTLAAAEKGLNEVVVIGYGTKTKSTVTGAISTVSSAQLANRPAANVVNSLQGLVPGMVISRGNVGRVGREADNLGIEIRGIASRSNPGVLIIVDGIPQQSGGAFALNNLNPDDIESISVLKDAQAAIYGSRAAGGVILITTKSGKSAKPVVALNSQVTLNTPGIERKQANILQSIEMWTEAYENDGVNNNYYTHLKPFLTQNLDLNKITVAKGPFPDTKDITLSNNDWMKIMWGNATQQQHTLSVSGKNGKSSYWVSMGVLDQHSMLQYGTNYNRKYNTKLKYDFDINDWLKIKTNVSIQTQKLVEPTDYDLIQDLTANSYAGKAKYTQSGKYYGFGGYLSTIGWAEQGGNRESRNTQVRTQFEAVATPIKNLDITGQLAINRDLFDEFALRTGFLSYTYDDDVIFNSNLYWGGKDQVTAGYSKNNQLVANLYANYKYNLKAHHFGLLAGGSHEEVETRAFSAYRNGNPNLLSNSLSFLGNGALTEQFNSEARSDYALQSAFSRLSYDYNQKYFFEGNFRYDASSKFAPGHKGAPFYGGSLGWVMTNEKFMNRLAKFIDFAKLRLSYGELGNQNGIGLYDYVQAIAFGGQYPFGPVNSPLRTLSTFVPSLASPDRSWEKLDVQNLGLDLAVLNKRLSVSFDYFSKTNKNMFYSKEFPSILGITPPQINGAELRTKGWEVALQWKDKIRKDFDYFVNVAVSDNTNKVLTLADSRIPGYGQNGFVEGYAYGSYFTYMYDGLIQSDAELTKYKGVITSGIPTNVRTGDVKFKDLNGDGKLTPTLYNPADPSKGGDLVYIGNSNIRYSYSINLGASWKGFYCSAILQGVGKWQVMDGNVAAAPFFRNPQAYHYHNTWATSRPDALFPKSSEDDGINGYNYLPSDAPFKFRNAAYIRVKNVQVGYNVPQKIANRAKLKSVQVYFSGSDLGEWSKIPKGFDPEKPFSIVNTPYPRSYSFGLNITL